MPPTGRHVVGPRLQACACAACFVALCQTLMLFHFHGAASASVSLTSNAAAAATRGATPEAAASAAAATAAAPLSIDGGGDGAAPSPPLKASASRSGSASRRTIPKILHQSWRDGGFPKTLFNWRWQQGLLDLNPGWELKKWTDSSSRDLIATHYPWFLKAYDAYPSYIQRCDASRYFILHHYGGVYADLDIECSKPFAPVLVGRRAVFSYKQGTNMSRGIVNALFATEARHPIWRTVFDLLVNRSAKGAAASTHVDVIRSTGPGLLREAIMMHMAAQEAPSLAALGVELLDSSVWHPIMPEQKRGRDTSDATRLAIANSHCYHHFVSSWMAHDKAKHDGTEAQRHGQAAHAAKAAKDDEGVEPSEAKHSNRDGSSSRKGPTSVPIGQGIRAENTWKSFDLKDKPAHKHAAKGGSASSTSSRGSSRRGS